MGIDGSGNINVTGYTNSSDGIATSGAYQSINRRNTGNLDVQATTYLAHFSSLGILSWATYYGGINVDNANGVSTDGSGNIYITGEIDSFANISSSGAYQTSYGGGIGDAFLAKFSNSGSFIWATYYGGSSEDDAEAVSTDGSGNVYITGITKSGNGIATNGAYQSVFGGGSGYDAFLAKFNSSGNLLWGTYYGGSGDDQGGGISIDGSGNVYMIGYTSSSTGIATTGSYQSSYAGGGSDVFLAKFNSSGNLIWGTYFGGPGQDFGYGVSSDNFGNVYFAGSTTSNTNISTIGAYQTSNGGGYDAFLAKFSSSGAEDWATYYGGTGDDGALGLCTDVNGNIFMTGSTASSNAISTSGAYQTAYAGGEDAFFAKFHEHNSGINSPVNSDLYGLSVYPNPFTDKTLVGFSLPASGHVKITLMDVNGKILSVPADRTFGSGKNEIEINATKVGLVSGTYFVNMEINGEVINKKIVVVK